MTRERLVQLIQGQLNNESDQDARKERQKNTAAKGNSAAAQSVGNPVFEYLDTTYFDRIKKYVEETYEQRIVKLEEQVNALKATGGASSQASSGGSSQSSTTGGTASSASGGGSSQSSTTGAETSTASSGASDNASSSPTESSPSTSQNTAKVRLNWVSGVPTGTRRIKVTNRTNGNNSVITEQQARYGQNIEFDVPLGTEILMQIFPTANEVVAVWQEVGKSTALRRDSSTYSTRINGDINYKVTMRQRS